MNDFRYALRRLRQSPGFTTVAVLTLGLGIGANTAIFSLIDTILLRFLPVQKPEELVVLSSRYSYPRYEKIRDRNQVFSGVFAASALDRINVDGATNESQQAAGRLVSGSYFQTLGVQALLGRTLTADDDRVPAGHPVVVISHAFWKRKYGGDPGVLGRTARLGAGTLVTGVGTSGFEKAGARVVGLEGTAFTIIGVAPPEFFGDMVGQHPDFWIPMMMQESLMPGRPWLARNTANWVQIMGRRKPGITDQQAEASLNVLYQQILLDEAGPQVTERQRRSIAEARVNLRPGAKGFSTLRGQFSEPLQILMGMVALVLLVSCANLANLLLARATARQKEISIRLAVGASRGRLIRQLFTESLLLALTGGLAGVLLGYWGSEFLLAMVSENLQSTRLDLAPDLRILAFTLGASLLTALLFGLAPAFRATRAETGRSRFPLGKALVVVQVALSLVLITGAGLLLRTLRNLSALDLGYRRDQIVLMRIDPITAGYRGDRISAVTRELLERIRALPGVTGATFSENGLFSGTESATSIDIEGFTPSSDRERYNRFDQAGPGYFEIVGIPILLGRGIGPQDHETAPRVTVINETMARFYFPKQSPLGRRLTFRRGREEVYTMEIVGVVRDAQDHNLRWEPMRRFYVSYYQPIDGITTANYEVRTALPAATLAAQLRRVVQAVDRSIPILHVKPLSTLIDESILQERSVARLAGWFGALALVLASVGLYGIMAYSVVRRTREIGIRVAVGARPGNVLRLVLRETLLLAAAGLAVGVPAALAATRLVNRLLFGLKPNDPATITAAVAVLAAVALAAGLVPARRATRIDPMEALRHE